MRRGEFHYLTKNPVRLEKFDVLGEKTASVGAFESVVLLLTKISLVSLTQGRVLAELIRMA
jgi:hypothetical protein